MNSTSAAFPFVFLLIAAGVALVTHLVGGYLGDRYAAARRAESALSAADQKEPKGDSTKSPESPRGLSSERLWTAVAKEMSTDIAYIEVKGPGLSLIKALAEVSNASKAQLRLPAARLWAAKWPEVYGEAADPPDLDDEMQDFMRQYKLES